MTFHPSTGSGCFRDGEGGGDAQAEAADSQDSDFAETLYQRISSSSDGMSAAEMTAAFPDVSRPSLYRALDKLVKSKRLSRTGKPRTAEVRYRATEKR